MCLPADNIRNLADELICQQEKKRNAVCSCYGTQLNYQRMSILRMGQKIPGSLQEEEISPHIFHGHPHSGRCQDDPAADVPGAQVVRDPENKKVKAEDRHKKKQPLQEVNRIQGCNPGESSQPENETKEKTLKRGNINTSAAQNIQ